MLERIDYIPKEYFQGKLMSQLVIDTKEAARLAEAHSLLREKMLLWMPDEGVYCSALLYGVTARRCDHSTLDRVAGQEPCPAIGLVVQGSRCFEAGGNQYHCYEQNCFIDMGGETDLRQITSASMGSPYLSISLALDTHIIRWLAKNSRFSLPFCKKLPSSIVTHADLGILDAFRRLVDLIANPELFFCLAPLIVREIHYRILSGPLGGNIRKLYVGQEFGRHNTSNSI